MGLNHIYKVIWSKTKNAWVVVSEIAKRDGKSSVKSVVASFIKQKSLISSLAVFLILPLAAQASPLKNYEAGEDNVYWGTGAASNGHNTVVGSSNRYNGEENVLIGTSNMDNTPESGGRAGQRDVLIGYGNSTKSKYVSLVGSSNDIRSNASQSIAIGKDNRIEDNAVMGIAIGNDVSVQGERGIAVGRTVTVRKFSIAIGDEAKGYGVGSLALGYSSQASSESSIAIGGGSYVGSSAERAVAINGRAEGQYSLGVFGTAAGNRDIVIGQSGTRAGGERNIVIGDNNTVYTRNNTVIGNNITVDASGKYNGIIVLGDRSNAKPYTAPTDTSINGINIQTSKYQLGLNPSNAQEVARGVMAIGNRQIKDVAAGVISATSTDAINGSQLYEAVRAVTVGANPDMYMHVNDGTAVQGTSNSSTNLGKANEKGGATGKNSVAIGISAHSTDESTIAIGQNTAASDKNAVAIGKSAQASDSSTIAIGDSVNAGSDNSIAIGKSSSANGVGALTIGTSNSANGYYSVVLGNSNYAYGESAIAIGKGAGASGNRSIAIGENSKAVRDKSISIGTGNEVNAEKSSAIGDPSYIDTAATGTHVQGNDNGTSTNPIKASASTFMGNTNLAGTTGTTGIHVVGNNNSVDSSNVMVMGNNVTVGTGLDGAVVLGNDSSTNNYYATPTNTTISGLTLDASKFYGTTTNGSTLTNGSIVSIGDTNKERQIKNVAAGVISATSTDAVNGSQLYEAVRAVTAGASPDVYMHVNDGTSTQGAGNATTNLGKVNEKGGAQDSYSIAIGVDARTTAASGATIGGSIAMGHAAKTEGDADISIGNQAIAKLNQSIAIGQEAKATNNYSLALGSKTESDAEYAVSIGYQVNNKGGNSFAIGKSASIDTYSDNAIVLGGNSNITNSRNGILLGSSSSIVGTVPGGSPANSSQYSILIGSGNHITDSNNAVSIGVTSNISQSISSVAIGNNVTVTNSNQGIAIGESSAVNNAKYGTAIGLNSAVSGQSGIAIGVGANASGQLGIAIGGGAGASGEKSISIGTLNEVKGAKSSAIGDPSYIDTTATGTHVQGNDNGTATNPIKASESTFMGNTNLAGTAGTTGIHVVGNNNTVDSSNVMVMGNGVNVGTGLDGAVVLGHASSADQYAAATDSTINGVTFEAAGYAGNTGLNKGSIVSVGATGAERQIKNVAAGAVTATSTDAINGSQLYKTAETILKMPINMAGDSGDTVGLKLGKTVNIKGSVTSGADVTDGNIAVVGDKATSTLSLKMAKNLTGLTSGTFTDATGNQTVINGAGVTVTPTGTGATPISITTSGINAGNQEIKGVKKGTTDDAAVNKKQMDDALAGISSTLTINDGTTDGSVNIKTGKLKVVGESGANALVTTTVSGDTISVGTSTKLQNAVTAAENSADKDLSNLSTTGSDKVKTLAQDAVKVAGTGLATVSDATAAGVKTYTVNVDEGKLVIDDTTGKIGATGASQGTVQGKDGVATTQNVASVVNSAIDKTKQALDDAKHNFAGDDATVISRKHGEQLNIKGGASTTASDLTSGNIAVVGDTTSGTLNIKMAKALTGLTSATYTDAAGNTQTVTGGSSTISDAAGNSTVVSKGGVTTTDAAGNTTTTAPTGVTVTPAGAGATPISVTTSGISAGNKEIKNVANGTTDDAAVNKKQMDDALKGATDNTVSLGSESGTTTAKKLSTTGGIKFNIKGETGANALITTSASGDDVTIAPTAKLTAAVTAAENSANKDLSNLSTAGDTYIKNLAKSAASWNVETNGANTTAVAGGDTVNFINGDNIAITNTGRSITIGTAKNVSFDKVTVGGVVIDKTDGINAGGKEIKGVATGTAADSAVNKAQMDAAITAAAGGALSTEKVVAKTLTGDNNLATVTGQTGNAKGETYEVSVSENAVKAVAQTAAQDAVKVAGTGLATVSDATAAGVKTYTVNVDEGKLVIDDTTGKVGAAGSTQGTTTGKNGVATTQDVASVVNSAIDKTKQALTDAKHDFAGDDATVISRKHGEQLNIKGGASTTATDLTSGNIAVVGDTTSGTLNIKLAKVLTGLTSATYTDGAGNTQTVTGGSSTISDAAGNSTVVSKGGVTTTDGTNTTTVAPSGVTATDGTHTVTLGGSGISAGGTEIKNVGKATTDDAAVNKKQMDDAVKAATDSISTLGDNKVSLGSDSGTTTAKKLSTTGGIKFNIKGDTGANALISTSATGDDVTIAPTAKLTAAVTAAEKSADKDLSNLSAAGDTYIKNLAKTAASWNVETNGAGTTAVAGGETVNFINGDNIAITNTGRSITIGTSRDVSFDKVTVGGIVLDKNTGINAGGKEIKGVANATSADAAVNKGQLDAAVLSAAGGALSIEKVEAGSVANGKLAAGDNNLASVSGLTGTAKNETYTVTVSENAVKAVAQTAAQDAVKVAGTGLATVSDATAAGVKTYTVNVDEGKLVIDDTTGKVGAAGSTQGTTAGKNGVATTQDVASVVNSAIDKTKQALTDAKHDFAGDDATVISRKHGEQLNIKGGASTTATDLTSGNIAVVGDTTSGTLNIKLAKVLTGLTSATYTDAAGNTQTVTGGSSTITDGAGNTTTITKGGMTTTDGTNTTTVAPAGVTATDGTNTVKLTGSGIDAGNTQIKNVGKATTDDAAVNKKQMDDAVKAATDSISSLGDNKVSLGSDSGTTTAKKLSTTGGIKFNIKGDTGANALITTSATGDDVTIAPTAKLSAAVTAAENSANKDLSNLSTAGNTYIQNLAKSAASWNVETNGAGTTAVAGGDTVNFINGDNIAITNTGRSITIGTAKNVSFDKVTVGGVVIDKNNGIDAGGKEITNVGPATSGNSAVNKTQMDTAITNAVNKATTDAKHDFGGDDTTVVTRKHGEKLNIKGGASTTAADLTSGNIAVLGDATTGTLNIRMAKALTGLSSATFTTPSGTTVINGGGMTITPSTTGAAPISITTGGINAGNTEIKNVAAGTTPNSAVNKQQMDSAISNATANVGFNTAGNTGTGSVSNGQTLTITGTNGIETNASGQSITVGLDSATRAQINNATTTANNAAKKDLSNIDNAGKQVIKDTAAWNVKVNSGTPETVKGGDTVTFNDGDNIKVTNTGKDITIATKKDVSFDKVTVGNVVIDKNTNRISGLANAANNDEAVNLGQMNAAISTATAGTGNIKYKANGGTQNSVALTTGFDFKGDSNIQITADPANSGVINYKLNPALTGITSISGGTGAPTITLNAGSGSTPGNVSINSNLDMGGKQINNIGAATHAGDAVNKAQMDQALQNIAGASSNAAKSYAYKAGAGAAALAALKPIQYDPLEPTQIMAGIGNYKSQTAVALGVAHYTNENTMFNLGVSLDSHDGIVNAGVTHKFGYSPEKKAIPDKYKGGPISSIYVMQDEVTALQAIVQKQAAENEALRQQNEDMQRKVDMILSKIH